jgi:predicted HTH transcriptional regulator
MEALELVEIIRRGEDGRNQFKENLFKASDFAADLVAFSNTSGGRIIIGVNDKINDIQGLTPDDIRRLNQLLANAATNNVIPSVNIETENFTVDNKLLLVVTVREGISKPYSDNNGVFWMKNGSDKRKVTSREEMQRMFQKSGLVYADEVPISGSTFADIDYRHFQDFYKKQYNEDLSNEGASESLGQLLSNLNLVDNHQLNLAGLMLFAKNPQKYRPAFVVKAVSFIGNDSAGTKYRDSEDISGCISELHKKTMSFILRNLRKVQGDKGFNSEGTLEISQDAIEEIVVNMILHRDYFISSPWRVMIFDNRVEIISPGSLPNTLTVDKVKKGVSIMRNPIIASFATKELPYKGIGTGIRRAVAQIPDLVLESDHDLNLFRVIMARKYDL